MIWFWISVDVHSMLLLVWLIWCHDY